MSVRLPGQFSSASASEAAFDAFGHEILAEKAAALGHAGNKAERALIALAQHQAGDEMRRELLAKAVDAVYAWFIHRELCGLRRHDDVIGDLAIPREVLVRLGAVTN